MTYHLGLEEKQAQKIIDPVKSCQHIPSVKESKNRVLKSPFDKEAQIFKRQYFLVKGLDVGLYSWTDKYGRTYIFKPRQGEVDFLSVLSHELFIYLDKKFNLEDEITAYLETESVLTSGGFPSVTVKNPQMKALLYDPVLKVAFSTLRAFIFEEKIREELKQKTKQSHHENTLLKSFIKKALSQKA